MVAFNFKAQFADDVELGKKWQTIRLKRRCREGDALQLYTGMRTRKCRLLRKARCSAVQEISIDVHGQFVAVRLDGELLPSVLARQLAQADGFDGVTSFAEFFEREYGGLPFRGWLIRWE
jgi:hypothetical protein